MSKFNRGNSDNQPKGVNRRAIKPVQGEIHRGNLSPLVERLSFEVIQPVGAALATTRQWTAYYGGRYWRRASSRALGLIFNGFESLKEILPNWS